VTPRDRQFETAVIDGGAIGAAAVDVATRAIVAGFAHDGLVSPALLELLLGAARPHGPLTQACGGAPPSAVHDLYVAGRDRALYCCVTEHGEAIVMAAPATMSVALGWALVRTLTGPGAPR
jgi:hypothetical protein